MKIKENLYAYKYQDCFILHNVLRSTWVLIDEEELQHVKKEAYADLSLATRNKLKVFQILKDEPLQLESIKGLKPKTAYLVITHKCNLKCVYCYAEAALDKDYEDSLSFVEWIDVLNQLKDAGIEKVIFTGGEVGLSRDVLKYIDYAVKIGLKTSLITNGTLLSNKKDALFLSERCESITISLDSVDESANDLNRGKGCYRLAMRAINNLLELEYQKIFVNAIITNNNLSTVDETLNFFEENNIIYKLSGFSELGRAKTATISLTSEERKMIETMKKSEERSPLLNPFSIRNSCGLGTGEFAVNPVGDVYACKLLETEAYKFGNTREQRIEEMLGDKNLELINSQSIDRLQKCSNCSFRYLCGGGCRAQHYYATNDKQGIDPSECNIIQETLKYQMYRTCISQ